MSQPALETRARGGGGGSALVLSGTARFPLVCELWQVRSLSLEVATKLLDVLVVQYPALREAVRSVAGMVMESAYETALEEVDDLLAKEKDPFTVSAGAAGALL